MRSRSAIALGLGLLCGGLTGRSLEPEVSGPPEVQKSAEAPPPLFGHRPPGPRRVETRDPQEQRQSEPSPEETLRIRQARATFLTRWGRPPQPPDPLPAAYTEDAIERTLLALLEHHGGELVELDCTYYPCTAILLQPAESLLGAQDFVDMGYPHAQVRGSSLTPENDWFVVQVGVPAHSLTLRETLFQWRIERRLTERNEALVSELLQEAVEAEVLHAEPHG